MLDVRRLQLLQSVVSSGSVTAAATHLGYTPSAVSQQIAALERQAGIPLLERHGRGVRPTAAGRLLTEHAATLGRHLSAAETALADLKAGRTGRVSLRYFPTAGATLVAPAVAALRRAHPTTEVALHLSDVDDDPVDIALVVRPPNEPASTPDGVRLVHLLDDAYRAVLPTGHPLAGRRALDLTDLAAEPWITNEWPAGPCLDTLLAACAAAGFTPDLAVHADDHHTAQGFVAAGLGITLIPRLVLTARHPGTVTRPVRHPEPTRAIHAAVRDSSLALPPVRALLDALRAAA